MDVTAEEALEIALIENLQRKDLTPFEEAEGYQGLAERHGYTHEEIAAAVGKSRTAITESLSLLQMPPRVRDAVQALGIQTKSHAAGDPQGPERGCDGLSAEKIAQRGLSRDDVRRETRGKPSKGRRPYTFKFKAPDKTYRWP